jgi:hypothetical protein
MVVANRFVGNDRSGPRLRKRCHDRRTALDGPMADLLGHYKRVHCILRHRIRYGYREILYAHHSLLMRISAPGFYHFGYAWPLHYVVEASRQVLFDLHSRIGLDFGVLIAWGAVNTLLFPFACYFMRWKSKHHVHEYYK